MAQTPANKNYTISEDTFIEDRVRDILAEGRDGRFDVGEVDGTTLTVEIEKGRVVGWLTSGQDDQVFLLEQSFLPGKARARPRKKLFVCVCDPDGSNCVCYPYPSGDTVEV